MAAEEFVAESQKLFYKTAYKTSPNKGKRIFNSIQLNLFILNNIRNFKKSYTKLTEYQLFCRKRISAKIKKKLNSFLKIMRAPKGSNARIACCTFKNQRASAVILETRNSTSGAIWFSTQRLLRNLLSLIRTNDDLSDGMSIVLVFISPTCVSILVSV